MCGISGKINYFKKPDPKTISKINNRLYHRGPDDGDVLDIDGMAIFGHRRLSIIDLSSNAHQPMQDNSKRYTITYNGEVYNYQELKKKLLQLGVRFKSRSDTEVVLYSYIHWGIQCFKKFNGMFALAIWDSKEKELIIAKDKFGEKPLCYTLLNDELTFASELTGLLEDESIKNNVTVSIHALNHYFAMGYILAPLTIYNEIFKLEPSTYIRYKDGKIVEKSRYWEYRDFFYHKTKEKEVDIIKRLDYLFRQAVSYRLISDVPVGTFLSGGLDSSGVSAIAKQYVNYDLHSFSMGFSQDSYSEVRDAKIVADYIGSNHIEKISEVDQDKRVIIDAIKCFDEPFSDTSLIPMVEISKLASQYVKVVLSGDAADEIFAGYPTYRADSIKKKLDIIPFKLRSLFSRLIYKTGRESNKKMNIGFKLRQFSKGMASDYRYAHYSWRELFNEQERIKLIGEEHKEKVLESNPFFQFKAYYDEVKELDHLSQHLYVDAKTWLVDDILVKVDRSTMAFSLEARVPFLDSNFVEYSASIPSEYKLNKYNCKFILKKMLERYLPKEAIDKKKTGFNAPINSWFNNNKENEFRFFNRYVLKEKGAHYAKKTV